MSDRGADRYLDLLKRCLINVLYQDPAIPSPLFPEAGARFDLALRLAGRDWPSQAHTMIGRVRLDHLQGLMEEVLGAGVPGDFLEAGVARGGAAIFMRGVLAARGVADRTVWVADSFAGMPGRGASGITPRSYASPEFAPLVELKESRPAEFREMVDRLQTGTSLDEVRSSFERYGLLDAQVRFLAGWFRDTLPTAPVGALALLRIDADLYDSTTEALCWLAPRVSPGGYVVIDDYGVFAECRQAVDDYLRSRGEPVEIRPIDGAAVCWRRGVPAAGGAEGAR